MEELIIIDKNVVFSAFLFWLLNCDDLECACVRASDRRGEREGELNKTIEKVKKKRKKIITRNSSTNYIWRRR